MEHNFNVVIDVHFFCYFTLCTQQSHTNLVAVRERERDGGVSVEAKMKPCNELRFICAHFDIEIFEFCDVCFSLIFRRWSLLSLLQMPDNLNVRTKYGDKRAIQYNGKNIVKCLLKHTNSIFIRPNICAKKEKLFLCSLYRNSTLANNIINCDAYESYFYP